MSRYATPTSEPATSRRGCCPPGESAPTIGCEPTCAATTRARRSTSSSSAAGPVEPPSSSAWPARESRSWALDAGPFWDPDADWVSDEWGSHRLYWTEPRVISGNDPVPLGSNNSGRGVGGSMIHYAGYTPRFHPSDFETATLRRCRGRLAHQLRGSQALLRGDRRGTPGLRPVAGPGATRTATPIRPNRSGATARSSLRGAHALGIETRIGPVAIANGRFGNRPHCIYRGFCLQGCKVNAKASPLITHIPDALAHGAEIRPNCMVTPGRRRRRRPGDRRHLYHPTASSTSSAARLVVVAGYSIETPRLLLLSASPGSRWAVQRVWPGRSLSDGQGAPQVAGRFDAEVRMYKAPPPEVTSEQFYETDPDQALPAGFALQKSPPSPSPMPNTLPPKDTGARCCASTCATTTTGRSWARCASSCPAGRTR